MAILQAGAAIGGTLIKGINALVDSKSAKSFNNTLKMVAANVELTHQRLRTLENRTSMMAVLACNAIWALAYPIFLSFAFCSAFSLLCFNNLFLSVFIAYTLVVLPL